MDFKVIVGIIAVLLTFIGYVPYIRDLIQDKIQPHIYSWFIWGIMTSIVFALQISDQAGPGAFVTLAAAMSVIVVFTLSFFKKGKRDIVLADTVFFILAFVALSLWLVAKQPVLSVILLTTTEVFAFIPTIRKSWRKPYSETLAFYVINTLRFALAVMALERYTVVTSLYPVVWFFGNGLFATMLGMRRKQLTLIKSKELT
ncbi:MAG: hypothetical protein UY13_C0002G0477 [Candidatus Pacebacteria bacterium GW2011_GWB1_47_8]|nr:MAG: hypothetical protein UX28_C0002G0036 [Candidatus Pacebacteria bacterium GW2011_GWA1_46_10]KKU84565.1 MAG: hypothetical protein UY13_C0002G0477 [Candidatus Pacebacteria bacterium GW2011_GWB1_47_8]HCR81653.1 hypothetical protein [Candidatus Paceibacterota bacterium]